MKGWLVVRRFWSAVLLAVLVGGGLVVTSAPASAATNFLGTEWDNCSGKLYVRDTTGTFRHIPRDDQNHPISVTLDGNGYWYWKCGPTLEWSRGTLPWRHRVEHLSVRHATDSREIRWRCFEII